MGQRGTRLTVAIAAALTAGTVMLHARLGEDEAGCDSRYNPYGGQRKDVPKNVTSANLLTGPDTATRLYSYEGWLISIGFREGRAARMCYQHQATGQKFVPAGPSKLADGEIAAILGANSTPGAWREIPAEELKDPEGDWKVVKAKASASRVWSRSDGAVAYLNGSIAEGLYLEDRAYVQERYRQAAPKPPPRPLPKF